MAVRVRRSVWGMSQDDPALTWYREAVAWLIDEDGGRPRSWRYLAFVHGVPGGVAVPVGADAFWGQCNHQNWFFLPWHRAYLASFEATVADVVERELGGPAGWALPYWDYTEDLATRPEARLMHPAFTERTLDDGTPNALWSRRKSVAGGDFGLSDRIVSLDALTHDRFTVPGAGTTEGFGGPDSMLNPGAGNGAIENLPHNAIHGAIGGADGFMSFPETAALDPIFWLHHANIDRLWERWRSLPNVGGSPDEDRWLDEPFALHDGTGGEIALTPAAVLDTTALLHGYVYDDTPVAKESEGGPGVMAIARPGPATLAAANEGPIELGDETATSVGFLGGPSLMGAAPGGERRVYLNLENVTGTGMPGDFDVLVRQTGDLGEPVYVGRLTTFGLERASDPDLGHGGGGITQAFDVTAIADDLGLDEASVGDFEVLFRRDAPGASDEAPGALAEYSPVRRGPATVRVGRVSLFYA